jgi:hypothetical protein
MSLILSGTDGLSDVDGTAATPAIRGTDANTGIFFPAADTIAFSEGGTEAMRIDSSGNVGIGTNSPAGKLDIISGTARMYFSNQSATAFFTAVNTANSAYAPMAINGSELILKTGDADRMRIDSSGNLLVAKTATSTVTAGAEIRSADGSFYSTIAATTNATSTYNAYSTGAGAYRFYVGMAGTVFATNTTITAISDQRLKENIRDLDDGLEKVMALQPRKFDWKEGKGADIKDARGFIAQEFEIVFPDMVEEWKDPAPEGEEPYKAVNANLIPTLVKAIQELKALVDTQASTIQALTTRITALEAK